MIPATTRPLALRPLIGRVLDRSLTEALPFSSFAPGKNDPDYQND